MNVVIIMKNQSESIKPMWDAVGKYGFNVVFVLDRCSDDSADVCARNGIPFIVNNTGEDRMTSYCRNIGFVHLTSKYGIQNTLFLDGDRHPVKGNLTSLVSPSTDVTLLYLENDFRDKRPVGYDNMYGEVYNDFFSCGVLFTKHACVELIRFYREHPEYGSSVIFPENVQSVWGIEDTHLGDICYHIGLSCGENKDIRLSGRFERNQVDSLDVIEARFKLRDKLNVKW